MTCITEPNFPSTNEDASKLATIRTLPVRPVFIMGLHRSGTTFLYDCIAKSFPVAHLSLYHLLYFDRLLVNKEHGSEQQDKDLLNRYFADKGISDRNIDGTHINADAVEEYGFLLRKKSGSFKINDHNADFFALLCQKLLAVQDETMAVLMKNPWDTGNAKRILSYYPDARFIYISREPIAVLNSMLNAFLSYLEGPQDYLEILLNDGNGRSSYRSGYILWMVLRGVRKLVGPKITARLARGLLAKNVAQQVTSYRKELSEMPANRAIEVEYSTLIDNPSAVMKTIAPLVNLPLGDKQRNIKVTQRKNLNPVLMNYEEKLNQLVDTAAS